MSFSAADARRQLLEVMGSAADRLSSALGLLGAGYELLDENAADKLEQELFGPVQHAYGRLRRAYTSFASQHELAAREFTTGAPGAPSRGLQGLLEAAVREVGEADRELAELQDSMLPVEVGDPELRAALGEVRTQIAGVPGRARELLRTFGR